MTKVEEKLYKAAEKAEAETSRLLKQVHGLFYDPEGGTEDDAMKMEEVIRLVREAESITKKIGRKLHG